MTATKQVVDKFVQFLQDEMAAVDTYGKAIHSLKNESAKAALLEAKAVHEERVRLFQNTVTGLGGQVPSSSGLWGAFARLMEGGSELLGDKPIVGCLEECEVKLLADYKSDLEVFDQAEHKMVLSELLPNQQALYEKILALHKSLH